MRTLLIALIGALVMSTGTAVAVPHLLTLHKKAEAYEQQEKEHIDYINEIIKEETT